MECAANAKIQIMQTKPKTIIAFYLKNKIKRDIHNYSQIDQCEAFSIELKVRFSIVKNCRNISKSVKNKLC